MIVKLTPTQIPQFWEVIKFVIAKLVKVDDYQSIFNYALYKLLNDKAQCWVRLNKDRKVIAVIVTEIQVNKITGYKQLYGSLLYSWRPTGNDEWVEDFNFIVKFATKEQCKQIVCETAVERAGQLYKLYGFKESLTTYTLKINGES